MPISEINLSYIKRLIHQESGIVLEDGKEYLIESRLNPLAQSSGFKSIDDFVMNLQSQPVNGMHHKMIEAMTINETYFFRDIHPFDALRDCLIPELIKKRELNRSLKIWCGACSTGQEPYSVAITLKEYFPQLTNWNITITGIDINEAVLEKARLGLYSQMEVNRGLPIRLLLKYFTKLPDQKWQINDVVKKLVNFKKDNLISPISLLQTYDIMFLRNVLIYFNTDTKQQILKQIWSSLADDGILFLGSTESTCFYDNSFEPRNIGKTTVYIKNRQNN